MILFFEFNWKIWKFNSYTRNIKILVKNWEEIGLIFQNQK